MQKFLDKFARVIVKTLFSKNPLQPIFSFDQNHPIYTFLGLKTNVGLQFWTAKIGVLH